MPHVQFPYAFSYYRTVSGQGDRERISPRNIMITVTNEPTSSSLAPSNEGVRSSIKVKKNPIIIGNPILFTICFPYLPFYSSFQGRRKTNRSRLNREGTSMMDMDQPQTSIPTNVTSSRPSMTTAHRQSLRSTTTNAPPFSRRY
jgi:hypothetical protein